MTLYVTYGMIITFFAGIISGITGFGFALVAVPLFMIVMDPKVAVPVVTINSFFSVLYLFSILRGAMQIKRIIPLIAGGIIGLPFGVYILVVARQDLLKIIVGGIIAVFAILLGIDVKKEVRNEKYVSPLIGMASGLLKGCTSLSGPPLVLFFINQDCEKDVFRANLIGYFVIMSVLGVAALAVGGLISTNVIKYSAWYMIPSIVGSYAGASISAKFNTAAFKYISLGVVVVAGILSILSGLRWLG